MENQPYDYLEQDSDSQQSGNDLPTYDDLAAQNGPNSRFGRWRGWIEKRAAERYADVPQDERRRRRLERGWGNDIPIPSSDGIPTIVNQPATPLPSSLHIQTNGLETSFPSTNFPPESPSPPESASQPNLNAQMRRLHPSHLKINNFGSRFLPHTTTPIRCLLPLQNGRYLLIGHDEGLSVIDTYPHEWAEDDTGVVVKGPEDAVARPIWFGEGVFQMSLLEIEDNGQGSTAQGVVLALVGPEPDSPLPKEEHMRTLRMYNLASLISLAKWAVAQKGTRPLDLSSRPNMHSHQSPSKKKHRHQTSFAKSLRSWIDQPNRNGADLISPTQSTASHLSTGSNASLHSPRSRTPSPNRSISTDSTSWDIVDDLPSRWALDFVPLATPSSRLASSSVLSYAMWNNSDSHNTRGGRLLAVAVKYNILLYEAPRGERAFRCIKEFYTPLNPRQITFFQQVAMDVNRRVSDVGPSSRLSSSSHKRSDSAETLRASLSHSHRALASPSNTLNYGTQLSLFVVFEKKAGWIRLADSAVGELEMFDDGIGPRASGGHTRDPSSPLNSRKSRLSIDASAILGKWIPIVQIDLPVPGGASTKTVHILTRGRKTHILPCPLPVGSVACRPMKALLWKSPPTSVTPRIATDELGEPFLQVVALGEAGIEVHEIPIDFLNRGGAGGKGKERATVPSQESIWVEDDQQGAAGFLCAGGHWDQPQYSPYHPLFRTRSTASDASWTSAETEDLHAQMERQQGMYAWCCKGLEDWRIFWLGGSLLEEEEEAGGFGGFSPQRGDSYGASGY
ncbi:hypothetical protein CYLTODRAFT_371136 [Cylindrobasidium torrendii FP15055 ss-10]|uniref:Uncharacterized protein n=1 Tax=Cylindrobasidium torrendii FP15055 ss-10 TaxID=1314674 RepID=A0A0D7BJU4_9AGAR|nr:hypothetical protein CYLTODRAFT_371136 [Cylindrobasidium torrendii FP15055 ss-10]